MILFGQSLSLGVLALLGLLATVGLLAMVSPNTFSRVARRGGKWFDSQKLLEVLDRRIDIDETVLPHSRVLGFTVLVAVVLLGSLMLRG
jgi:hypothetical protein